MFHPSLLISPIFRIIINKDGRLKKKARWMNCIKHETLANNPSQNYVHKAIEHIMAATIFFIHIVIFT